MTTTQTPEQEMPTWYEELSENPIFSWLANSGNFNSDDVSTQGAEENVENTDMGEFLNPEDILDRVLDFAAQGEEEDIVDRLLGGCIAAAIEYYGELTGEDILGDDLMHSFRGSLENEGDEKGDDLVILMAGLMLLAAEQAGQDIDGLSLDDMESVLSSHLLKEDMNVSLDERLQAFNEWLNQRQIENLNQMENSEMSFAYHEHPTKTNTVTPELSQVISYGNSRGNSLG